MYNNEVLKIAHAWWDVVLSIIFIIGICGLIILWFISMPLWAPILLYQIIRNEIKEQEHNDI